MYRETNAHVLFFFFSHRKYHLRRVACGEAVRVKGKCEGEFCASVARGGVALMRFKKHWCRSLTEFSSCICTPPHHLSPPHVSRRECFSTADYTPTRPPVAFAATVRTSRRLRREMIGIGRRRDGHPTLRQARTSLPGYAYCCVTSHGGIFTLIDERAV